MKVELCSVNGYKIYPRHGQSYARAYEKVCQFVNAKYKSSFPANGNARQISWTVVYRRKQKKNSLKKFQRKVPAMQSNSKGPSLVHLFGYRG